MKNSTLIILVSLSSFFTTSVFAEDDLSVEERLTRMERLVNSKGLVDVMVRVESLQSELQRLVGEIELQKHGLDEIKKRQRDLYLDIDRRILQIERRSGSGSVIPDSSKMNSTVNPITTTPDTYIAPTQTNSTKTQKGKRRRTSRLSKSI